MGYFPIPVEGFGGLNLVNDPGEVGFGGAIDLLNVDLDQPGRIRSRDGYAVLGTKASAGFDYLYPFVAPNGTFYVLAWNGSAGVQVFNGVSGATVSTPSGTTGTTDTRAGLRSAQLAVTATSTKVYVAAADEGLQVFDAIAGTWSNTTAATVGASWNRPSRVGFTPFDQRLALAVYDAGVGSGQTVRLRFSDPGAHTTFGANNYIDLVPGTTAQPNIEALVTWRNLLFAFKRDVFFTFYGTSTDSTGNPIFNYRTVEGFGGYTAASGREGVYFYDGRAVYLTTGGTPTRISQAIEPYLQGFATPFFIPPAAWSSPTPNPNGDRLTVGADGRVYLQLGSGATFVYDPETQGWTCWDLSAGIASNFTPSSVCADLGALATATKNILFITGDTHIYKKSPTATTDNGTALTSRYQSGFESLSPPRRYIDRYGFGPSRKRVRSWRVQGTGTVTMAVAADYGSTVGSTALTLGTSPAVAEARYSRAIRGSKISYKLSGTAPWSVNDLVAMLADTRAPASDVSGDT